MANFNFNAAEVEPQNPFAPLPAGEYIAQIVDSDVKTNRAGTGQYLALQFEILDGEFKNRRVFTNLTVSHQNKTAEQIGQGQLSALCRAVGVMQLTETSQLHGRPVKIKLKVTKDPQYGDGNDVTGFEPAAGGVGNVAPAPAAGATSASTSSGAATPPWLR